METFSREEVGKRRGEDGKTSRIPKHHVTGNTNAEAKAHGGAQHQAIGEVFAEVKSQKPMISLQEEIEKEVYHNVQVFSNLGVIGRFKGLWPSLCDLHH